MVLWIAKIAIRVTATFDLGNTLVKIILNLFKTVFIQISWLHNLIRRRHAYQDLITIFILGTGKQVLWLTVKIQMKCHIGISSGSALFAKIYLFSGTEIHHFIESLTSNPLKYKTDNSILLVSICMRQHIRMKRVNNNRELGAAQALNMAETCGATLQHHLN